MKTMLKMIAPAIALKVVGLACMTVSVASAETATAGSQATAALFQKYRLTEAPHPVTDLANWEKPTSVVVFVPAVATIPVANYAESLRDLLPDARVNFVSNTAAFKRAARDADVAILGNCAALDKSMKQLRWVQKIGVGIERCLEQPLDWTKTLLTNTAGMSGPFIAEHTITMALMLSHGMPAYHRNQLNGQWLVNRTTLTSVRAVTGKTVLVLGLGGIGSKIAEKAAALGMRVTAMRNSRRAGPDFIDYIGLPDELHELARDADFVVNTLPLTPRTKGIFDADFFSTMKTSGYFISVGRGKSVITADLVAALETGAIAGAGLDVTDPEPLPESHPLWRMPNVLITPHASSFSGITSPDRFLLIQENIRRYANGEKMLNVVDPELGY
jgi:phosphoglycerate dehydrogenase-like enzyme